MALFGPVGACVIWYRKVLLYKITDLLYKITVRSLIDYSLPLFANTLKLTEIKGLENIQYRAARVATGALNFISRERLFEELDWETIGNRPKFLSLCIFHKIHAQVTGPLIKPVLQNWIGKEMFPEIKGGGICPTPSLPSIS